MKNTRICTSMVMFIVTIIFLSSVSFAADKITTAESIKNALGIFENTSLRIHYEADQNGSLPKKEVTQTRKGLATLWGNSMEYHIKGKTISFEQGNGIIFLISLNNEENSATIKKIVDDVTINNITMNANAQKNNVTFTYSKGLLKNKADQMIKDVFDGLKLSTSEEAGKFAAKTYRAGKGCIVGGWNGAINGSNEGWNEDNSQALTFVSSEEEEDEGENIKNNTEDTTSQQKDTLKKESNVTPPEVQPKEPNKFYQILVSDYDSIKSFQSTLFGFEEKIIIPQIVLDSIANQFQGVQKIKVSFVIYDKNGNELMSTNVLTFVRQKPKAKIGEGHIIISGDNIPVGGLEKIGFQPEPIKKKIKSRLSGHTKSKEEITITGQNLKIEKHTK